MIAKPQNSLHVSFSFLSFQFLYSLVLISGLMNAHKKSIFVSFFFKWRAKKTTIKMHKTEINDFHCEIAFRASKSARAIETMQLVYRFILINDQISEDNSFIFSSAFEALLGNRYLVLTPQIHTASRYIFTFT